MEEGENIRVHGRDQLSQQEWHASGCVNGHENEHVSGHVSESDPTESLLIPIFLF